MSTSNNSTDNNAIPNAVTSTVHGIPQGDPLTSRNYFAALTGGAIPLASSSAMPAAPFTAGGVFLNPAPTLLPESQSRSFGAPISRTSTMDGDDIDISYLIEDDMPVDTSSVSAPVTASAPAAIGKGKTKAVEAPETPPAAIATPAPNTSLPNNAERVLTAFELTRPTAPGTRWSAPVANAIHQDAHTVASFVASESQRMKERLNDVDCQIDDVRSTIHAIATTLQEGPHNNDDSLLARLSNMQESLTARQNDSNAVVTQLQRMYTAQGSVSAISKTRTGKQRRPLRLRRPLPAPTSISLLPEPASVAFAPAMVQAHPILSAPVARPSVHVPPPAAPFSDMQAALTAAFQASLSAVLATMRGREDDDIVDGRNVRHHSDAPVASTSAPFVPDAPVDAPDAPDAPARQNDPACEVIFRPVNWKRNINSECRTIIAQGMKSRPNMRGF
ncbi:hypothetical protein MVEN_00636200 [Mycena venus]|uniref:Uncharacterized protein n=1 Tax=Mycena venus TaxID=2733690 RepID=A0A8H6YPL9_9AGAR|nr:hypothetical protein MVEN_00636200 [Mycena venus]